MESSAEAENRLWLEDAAHECQNTLAIESVQPGGSQESIQALPATNRITWARAFLAAVQAQPLIAACSCSATFLATAIALTKESYHSFTPTKAVMSMSWRASTVEKRCVGRIFSISARGIPADAAHRSYKIDSPSYRAWD